MKWIIFTFLFSFNVNSQNLIPNPSFELVDSCALLNTYVSSYGSTIKYYCRDWFDDYSITYSSSNLMGFCLHSNFDVPNTIYGYSYPYQGERFAGIGFIGFENENSDNAREYVSVKLLENLKKDSAYCISFYYKNPKTLNKDYSLDNIGVLFTIDTLTEYNLLNEFADIRTKKNVQLINTEWEMLSTFYIANGDEVFFNLGVFGDKSDSNFETTEKGWVGYMYFIDNISVIKCNKDSLFNVKLELEANIFTPNNDLINDVYRILHQNIITLNVQIYNRWGTVVREYDGLTTQWLGNNDNGKALSNGVYYIIANAVDKYGKIHQKTKTVTLTR